MKQYVQKIVVHVNNLAATIFGTVHTITCTRGYFSNVYNHDRLVGRFLIVTVWRQLHNVSTLKKAHQIKGAQGSRDVSKHCTKLVHIFSVNIHGSFVKVICTIISMDMPLFSSNIHVRAMNTHEYPWILHNSWYMCFANLYGRN